MKYYLVVGEWLYPTESGRDFVDDADTLEEALELAKTAAVAELPNFAEATGEDTLPPEAFCHGEGDYGVIVTGRSGLEDWYYAVRIVEVNSLQETT